MNPTPVELAAAPRGNGPLLLVNPTLTLAAVLAVVACGSGAKSPTLSYAGVNGTTGVVGTAMTVSPTTLASNGAAITACGIKSSSANSESFPATLRVDASTPRDLSSGLFTVSRFWSNRDGVWAYCG